jgi:protein-disulfide isomerase
VNTKGAPVRGEPDAKVAVVEFSDFQCPYCGGAVHDADQIAQTYGDKVRIVFKHCRSRCIRRRRRRTRRPRPRTARASSGDARQDLRDQKSMSPEKYREYAREIGLDLARFDRDVADASVKQRIDADAAEAAQLGITGTPAFFVNGRYLKGAVPFEEIKVLLDEDLGKTS